MMNRLGRGARMGAAAAALGLAIVLSGAGQAMAAGGSGTRSCPSPKEVTGYSDQTGAGWHYFASISYQVTTQQPAYQRGQFHSYTWTSSSPWTIYAPIVYSYGATCL